MEPVKRNAKPTDAPWELYYDHGEGHVIRMESAIGHTGVYSPQHVIEYHHGLLEDAETEADQRQFAEAEANARLICIAPELLDLAQHLAEVTGRYDGDDVAMSRWARSFGVTARNLLTAMEYTHVRPEDQR